MMSAGLSAALRARPARGFPMAWLALDFVRQRYWYRGCLYNDVLKIPGASFTRASVMYALNSTGSYTKFSSGRPAITDRGFFSTRATTNSALWCRDLTNAVWVASNMTTALTATGVDGAANTATKLTATGANATVLQTFTHASAINQFGICLRRVTGSGNVDLTMDNGTTWTTIAISSVWRRYNIPEQTLANGTFGIRLVTSGDEVEADFALYSWGSGPSYYPLIETTTAAVASADDMLSITPPSMAMAEHTLFIETRPGILGNNIYPESGYRVLMNKVSATTHQHYWFTQSATTHQQLFANISGTTEVNANSIAHSEANDVISRHASRIADNDFAQFTGGSSTATDAGLTASTGLLDRIYIGGSGGANSLHGEPICKVVVWNTPFANADLNALTRAVPLAA